VVVEIANYKLTVGYFGWLTGWRN